MLSTVTMLQTMLLTDRRSLSAHVGSTHHAATSCVKIWDADTSWDAAGIPSTSISSKPVSTGHNPRRHSQRSGKVLRRGFGKDTVEGWIDLSKLVSGSGGIKTAYEDLSYKIGHDVYIDVSGWHLFLREVKAAKGLNLAQALAQQFGQDISSKKYNKSTFEEVLKKVPIKLGGGKAQLPLMDLLPSGCVQDLERILEDFERDS